jgi:hypothetical protein
MSSTVGMRSRGVAASTCARSLAWTSGKPVARAVSRAAAIGEETRTDQSQHNGEQ